MSHLPVPREAEKSDGKRRERAPIPGGAGRWRCLQSTIGVGVAPLRNLTGDADQQRLTDAFTDDLLTELVEHGRGFSLQRLTGNPTTFCGNDETAEPEFKYLVTGSAQRGEPGMLRVNVRIIETATSQYLWARRYELSLSEPAPVQTRIVRRISQQLHVLLLQQEIDRACLGSGSEPELYECLSSAASALEGELRQDHTAEAQRWFLAALADDPRSVEALAGLARTCQELVSNPWWGDSAAPAVAADLGREVVAIALNLAPGAADAHCIQGMLYSAAGQLDDAARAFERALSLDRELAIAHGFAGYNAAFRGNAGDTLPAIERGHAAQPHRSPSQHLVLFRRICRAARRPDRSGRRAAREIPGTQPQLWKRATVPDGGTVAERAARRGRQGRRILPGAIPQLPRWRRRATLVFAVGLCYLSCSNPAGLWKHPRTRGGGLIWYRRVRRRLAPSGFRALFQ